MIRRVFLFYLPALASAFPLAGCASVPNHFDSLQQSLAQRTGAQVHWAGHDRSRSQLDAAVEQILSRPVSPDDAVRLALLNNHLVQARLAEFGIAQADVVQSGLIKNPVLNVIPRFPDKPPSGVDLEISVEEDFVSLLMLPARRQLAEARAKALRLQTESAIFDIAQDTRKSYYAWQAAEQIARMRAVARDAADALAQIAQKQHDAGNISELDLAEQQLTALQSGLDLADAQARARDLREELSADMGLSDSQLNWSADIQFPDPPASDPQLADLQKQAVNRRLDLAIARQAVRVAAQQVGLADRLRFFPEGAIGVDTEKSPGGQTVTGPMLSLPIPLFDAGQAQAARAGAQFEQAVQEYQASMVESASQIRRAGNRLRAARARVEQMKSSILPLHQQIVDQSLRYYNGMLLGVYQLIAARQNQNAAAQMYIESLRDYWIARSELFRAVGGNE